MKSIFNIPASHPLSGDNWQLFAELELPIDSNAARTIHSWLIQIFNPLDLSADFLDRISKSAQEAVLRAMEPQAIAKTSGYIHLLVFAPRPREPERNGKTWGFFRIDKLERLSKNENLLDHSIEFYLYVEGE